MIMPADVIPAAASRRVDRMALARFLNPKSVAVVGAREESARHAPRALLESGVELYFVKRSPGSVFGQPVHPDLLSIGRPIDAVLSLVNARAAVEIVEQAAAVGAGGVVVNAAGFAEVGGEGSQLQERLVQAAGDMPVLGPNCNGYINVAPGLLLGGSPELPLRAGSIGFITHSGAFITDIAVSAKTRNVGFSWLISTGNEARTDMVDYLDHLIDDSSTRVICLAVESLRRPQAFFQAAERARLAGKPLVALKLGRSRQGLEVARSHTGAVVAEPWTYDAAFRQHGVVPARDLGDLLDRAALFDQLPPSRWSSVERPAVLTISGGAAALASDICEREGLELPDLEELRDEITSATPHTGPLNPLDVTGSLLGQPDVLRSLVRAYAASPKVDSLLMAWTIGLASRQFGEPFVAPFAEVAETCEHPTVLAGIGDSSMSDWALEAANRGVALGQGLPGAVRGLTAMRDFAQARLAPPRPAAASVGEVERPAIRSIETGGAHLLPFDATMELLATSGVSVAPYLLVSAEDDPSKVRLPFDPPYVTKLANCAHRSDIGAVHFGVTPDTLERSIQSLRALSRQEGLPAAVCVQPQVQSRPEVFVGADSSAELGPMVVCGMGGVHVEALQEVTGRLLPLSDWDVDQMLREMDALGIFTGMRGGGHVDRKQLAGVVEAVGALVASTHAWLVSLDINPLLQAPEGLVAVDALAIVRPVDDATPGWR
jgi:acetate---CoA ligase (ADP-forming)